MSLPSGYKLLEYIQSSGTQYIDTGVKAKNDTKVIADCEITYGTGWVKILGSYEAGAAFSWWANASNIYAYYGTKEKLGVGATGKHILTANGNMWSDSVNDFAFSYSSFTATTNLYLFSVNGGGTYDNARMKLYSCQIYDGETIIRDFVPCINAYGEVGLYDLVGKQFYGNSGTGAFIDGPVAVPEMPERLTASVNGACVTLTWSASSDATGYKISRDGVQIADQIALSFTDTVEDGQTYVYTVVAYNGNGDSEPAKLTVQTPPGAPTTLYQTMAVRLAWSVVDGATKYNVYRDNVLLTSTTETTFIDLTAAENTEYTYAVSAVNSAGESPKTIITVYTKSGYFLYKPYVESATFQ